MTDQPKRLEAAKFERAEAALRWEDADATADETGRKEDRVRADDRDRLLVAAEGKIKAIQAEK
jgi:hypothetical protein